MPLTSPRFAANARLQAAATNSPPMRQGETGEAVQILQQALLDLGFPMPVSTATGTKPPDGKYGNETGKVVRNFQTQHGLQTDGIAGRETLGLLDELLAAPAPSVDLPPVPHYELTLPGLGQSLGWTPLWKQPLLGVLHVDLDLPPALNLRSVLGAATATPPAAFSPLRTPVQLGKTGPPWQVPFVTPRTAKFGDLMNALLKVPEVERVAKHVEALGQREVNRIWTELKTDPLADVLAVPVVVGAGFAARVAAPHLDLDLPTLPIPLPLPGLRVKLQDVNPARGRATGILELDVTQFIREFK